MWQSLVTMCCIAIASKILLKIGIMETGSKFMCELTNDDDGYTYTPLLVSNA